MSNIRKLLLILVLVSIVVPVFVSAYVSATVNIYDKKQLVDKANNVFVAKIVDIKSMEARDGIAAETQFNAEVIYNIKGDLKGIVTVNQLGGYVDGELYVFRELGINRNDFDSFLLKPGNTYLLATRLNASGDWHTVQSLYPSATQIISTNPDLNSEDLEELAKNDNQVKEFETLYGEVKQESKKFNLLNSKSKFIIWLLSPIRWMFKPLINNI